MRIKYIGSIAIVAIGAGMWLAYHVSTDTHTIAITPVADMVTRDLATSENSTEKIAQEKVLGVSEQQVEDVGMKSKEPKTIDKTMPSDDLTTESSAIDDSCHSHDVAVAFMCLLNTYRVAENLEPLVFDPALAFVAESHSAWMSAVGELSHIGDNGLTFVERCQRHRISCSGENVAYGFRDAEHLLDMWQQSMLHDKNLLGPFQIAGIGISGGYATLVFEY